MLPASISYEGRTVSSDRRKMLLGSEVLRTKDAAGQSQAEEENVAAGSPDDVGKCGAAGQPNVMNGDAC